MTLTSREGSMARNCAAVAARAGGASTSIRGGVCATAAKGQVNNPARRNRERIVIRTIVI
jgi:hypothetical protein